jgi:uncharacterized protein (TIGR00156 family)
MKKLMGFVFLLGLFVFSCTLEKGLPVYSISDAKRAMDGTPAVLEGTIGKFIGDERCDFSNGSDSIPVEIDNEWRKGPDAVKQGDTVTIYGEVEKELWEKPYISVDRVVKNNKNETHPAAGSGV